MYIIVDSGFCYLQQRGSLFTDVINNLMSLTLWCLQSDTWEIIFLE